MAGKALQMESEWLDRRPADSDDKDEQKSATAAAPKKNIKIKVLVGGREGGRKSERGTGCWRRQSGVRCVCRRARERGKVCARERMRRNLALLCLKGIPHNLISALLHTSYGRARVVGFAKSSFSLE